MIHIRTASRLHFGLLSLPGSMHWPDREGRKVVPARQFGGVGLMVESPGIALRVEKSSTWSAEGPLADRALKFAQQCVPSLAPTVEPCRLTIEGCAPQHAGLGTGTQLGLAVALALNLEMGLPRANAAALAAVVERGLRSALGVHGFDEGGFLVEGGKNRLSSISPLVARQSFPEDWPIILVIGPGEAGQHGAEEMQMFERLSGAPPSIRTTEALCRLVLLGLLPALAHGDYAAFAEALHDFNARSGELFEHVQHGIYSSARAAELIVWLRREGVPAAGQSSWGPTVFGIVDDVERARAVVRRVREVFGLPQDQVVLTRASNAGARVTTG